MNEQLSQREVAQEMDRRDPRWYADWCERNGSQKELYERLKWEKDIDARIIAEFREKERTKKKLRPRYWVDYNTYCGRIAICENDKVIAWSSADGRLADYEHIVNLLNADFCKETQNG